MAATRTANRRDAACILGGSPGLGGGPDLAKNALEHTLSVALDAEGGPCSGEVGGRGVTAGDGKG